MNASDFLTATAHFFNDLIGAVVPGLLLIGGFYAIWGSPPLDVAGGVAWLSLLVGAFAAGHALLALHRLLSAWLGKLPFAVYRLLTGRGWKWQNMDDPIEKSSSYVEFRELVISKLQASGSTADLSAKMSLNDLRSIAMSVSHESAELGRRFMFISLFCYATSMAILVVVVAYLVTRPSTLLSFHSAIGIVAFGLFYLRGIEFNYRALNAPFAVALTTMLFPSPRK